MNNRELKYIIEQIEGNEPMLLQDIAAKAKINRSHLSTLMNTEDIKKVSDRLVAKIKKQFPAYFPEKPTNQQIQHANPDHIYVEKLIAEKEARRLDAMALAEKMEAHYNDMKNALERAQITINEVLKPIKEKTEEILTNSKEIAEDISALTDEVQAEHRAMMDSIDVAAKQPIGTTYAKSDTVELASQKKRASKGKAEAGK